MFLGLAPLVGVLISTAVSIATSLIISALTRPKQDDPEGRLPGSAIGRNIPEGFNDFVLNDIRWVEPESDERAFVQRDDDELYLTAIGILAGCLGGAFIYKLWVAGKKEFDLGGATNFIDREVVFNQGLPDQNPVQWQDSNWRDENPFTDVVAYLNHIVLGFYSLGVHKRGLSFPGIKIVLRSNITYSVGDICKKKAMDAGIEEANIDISEIENETCLGYTCDRNGNSYIQQLESLMLNHLVSVVETPEGILSFRKIERPQPVVNIPLEHLGNRQEGNTLEYLISREFTDLKELPSFIILNFIDNNRELEQGSIESDFHPRSISSHAENISTEEVLNRAEAKIIANRLLHQIWDRSIKYKFTLPFDYKSIITPLDVVTINDSFTVQIDKITVSADFRLSVEAWQYEPANIGYSASGSNAIAAPSNNAPAPDPIDETENNNISNGELILLDSPLGFNEQTENGVYAITNVSGDVYLSRDNEATYIHTKEINSSSTYGELTNTLGNETKDINGNTYPINTNLNSSELPIIDNTNIVTCTLNNGNIPSLTQSQFDNEEIILFVGREISGIWEGEYICANISVNNSGIYTLSELKRGLRGTEYYIDKHVPNEKIFLIDSSTPRIELNSSDINQQIFYKYTVSDTQELDDVSSSNINYLGESIYSYSPTNLEYTEDDNGDITFSLQPRSRLGLLQLGEQNNYELDILDATDTVVRTLTGLTYSNADITSDGLSSPFKVNAYRINSLAGRGYPGYFRELVVSSTIPFVPLSNSVYTGIKTIDSLNTTTYTLTEDDRGLLIKIDSTTSSVDVTFPDDLGAGFYITIRNIDNASGNDVNLLDNVSSAILSSPLSNGQTIKAIEEGVNDWNTF